MNGGSTARLKQHVQHLNFTHSIYHNYTEPSRPPGEYFLYKQGHDLGNLKAQIPNSRVLITQLCISSCSPHFNRPAGFTAALLLGAESL